jgi:hypothetical protein
VLPGICLRRNIPATVGRLLRPAIDKIVQNTSMYCYKKKKRRRKDAKNMNYSATL